uniref:V-SNARE coiled-coil homology domain-containing protein n=1 Tax=Euplotes crassus TaxID=5936 RepID=A0A7S3K708_EUPCR|mmetsp:Transcript_10501/g.10353  ORF Transcript_10501/g.10353 Transcript_10501/m.10353 type:complete len:122 (+) Transcript_10501:50-415(+)
MLDGRLLITLTWAPTTLQQEKEALSLIFKNVRLGGEKIEKLKQSLLDSIIKMNDNREQVEKLNANVQSLRQEAYKFKKQAQEVEDEMKKRNRWCTKRFIFLYLIITILVLAAIIIVLILKL